MCNTVNGTQVCAYNCSQTRCTSVGPERKGYDCWAGSVIDKCVCSVGQPVLIGTSKTYGVYDRFINLKGDKEYEYTCCTAG